MPLLTELIIAVIISFLLLRRYFISQITMNIEDAAFSLSFA
jgi:hypothetical protein